MPRYTYRCEACEDLFEISHSMFHEQDECVLCGEVGHVTKVPSSLGLKVNKERKPGELVKRYLKDAALDLKKEKVEYRKEKE